MTVPNQTPEQIAAIVGQLSEAQKRFIRAASGRRFKRWSAILRHAKVRRISIFRADLLEYGFTPLEAWRLSPLGLAVRRALEEGE